MGNLVWDYINHSGEPGFQVWEAAKKKSKRSGKEVLELALLWPLLTSSDRDDFKADIEGCCKEFLSTSLRPSDGAGGAVKSTARPWLWCAVLGLIEADAALVCAMTRAVDGDDSGVVALLLLCTMSTSDETLALALDALMRCQIWPLGPCVRPITASGVAFLQKFVLHQWRELSSDSDPGSDPDADPALDPASDPDSDSGPVPSSVLAQSLLGCPPALYRLANLLSSSEVKARDAAVHFTGAVLHGASRTQFMALFRPLKLGETMQKLWEDVRWRHAPMHAVVQYLFLLCASTYHAPHVDFWSMYMEMIMMVMKDMLTSGLSDPHLTKLLCAVVANVLHWGDQLRGRSFLRKMMRMVDMLMELPLLRHSRRRESATEDDSGLHPTTCAFVACIEELTSGQASTAHQRAPAKEISLLARVVNEWTPCSVLMGRTGTMDGHGVAVLYLHECEERIRGLFLSLGEDFLLAGHLVPLHCTTQWPLPSVSSIEPHPYSNEEADVPESFGEETLSLLERVGERIVAAIAACKTRQTNVSFVNTSGALVHDRDEYQCEKRPTVAVYVWHKGFVPEGELSVADLLVGVELEGVAVDVREGGFWHCNSGVMASRLRGSGSERENFTIGLISGDEKELKLITAAHAFGAPTEQPAHVGDIWINCKPLNEYTIVYEENDRDVAAIVVAPPPDWLLDLKYSVVEKPLDTDLHLEDLFTSPPTITLTSAVEMAVMEEHSYVHQDQAVPPRATVFKLGGNKSSRCLLDLGKAWAPAAATDLSFLQPPREGRDCLQPSELPQWHYLGVLSPWKYEDSRGYRRNLQIGDHGDSGALVALLCVGGRVLGSEAKVNGGAVEVNALGLGLFMGKTTFGKACFLPWCKLAHAEETFGENLRLSIQM